MADEWFKVGSAFTVTLLTTPLITLTSFTGQLVMAKRPDGRVFEITPDSFDNSSMVATVTVAMNPLSVSGGGKWKDGYAGAWEFYPYCVGSGGAEFHGKEGIQEVHPQWRNNP